MTRRAPKNVIVKRLLLTDLSQQLRNQRNFLRWMARKYKENPEQAAAFETGARLFDELRAELLAGDYDADSGRKEVFTRATAGAADPPAKIHGRLELTPAEIAELDAAAEELVR